ncbi:MAG TPA: bifunctional D-glycero-beta-D-manno-heptose-7-phosphate kinase/D-glycero-beta-D-manno-heptose 1-phosphate adenylyltransferase HldE [Thiothrix sp.]|nr:bifunctional D-glycero-beta-D-manno-heptose-7-phosphate kinase/D-glycero-beta-D-manno-heptose 1-phosphate adenylyltransferase HldE [Thiothrix sp.]
MLYRKRLANTPSLSAYLSSDLPDFSQATVLVVGDIMLDRYWLGDTQRISPEAPVPVVKINESEDRPGGAANVALNMAKLGCHVHLLGYTGEDDHAQQLEQCLQNDESTPLQVTFIKHPQKPTITKLRVMSRNQQQIRLDFEQNFADMDHQPLLEAFQTDLAKVDLVVLSDYRKGTLHQANQLIALAKAQNKPIMVDPKSRDFADYTGADLITPNLKEMQAAVGTWADETALIQKTRTTMNQHQIDNILITRSEQGMTLVSNTQEPVYLPTEAREVYDVTGAGDTVIALLAAAWASGASLTQATMLANIAAGIVVGKMGTASVTCEELLEQLAPCQTTAIPLDNEDALLQQVEHAKAKGETIVMTNGCFDLLHAGHVRYLNEARALGDRLIVAVNTDDSVRRLKGETRPINTVENRMTVLAALGAVDWVIAFSEDTPERLICKIKPNLLVKGGDNDPQHIPGNQCVWDNGGDVKVLSFKDDVSTTQTIARIQSRRKESSLS